MYWWMSAASARAEQERRDLEVEHRRARALDGGRHALERRAVAEVARHVGQPRSEAVEDRGVERLAGALDRGPRALAQVVGAPVVDGDADDRAVQQPARL